MKKVLFFGLFLSITSITFAQRQMQVWQDGVPTSFAVAEVDSVTFEDKNTLSGKVVGTICCIDTINQSTKQGYFIITTANDSILTFSDDVRTEQYYGIIGVYAVEYDIPFQFTFKLLNSFDENYIHYRLPNSNSMLPTMDHPIEHFRQALVKRFN